MRRRRHVLQVSTFPFLAVLLCAMGSLILLLLVIDRRAKAVARAKAWQAMARVATEEQKASEARNAERENRRLALRSQLAAQEEELRSRIDAMRRKAVDAGTEHQVEQARHAEAGKQMQSFLASLEATERQTSLQRSRVTQNAQQTEAARHERAQLTAQLERLEQILNDLKAARKREQQTYSVVPYRGKHGDNRRPLYVECTAKGLVLHPERQNVAGFGLSGETVRAAVERRLAGHPQENDAGKKPYLLLLVRPDGITNYYRTQGALRGLEVDFGYEFIEQDWQLDFPADDQDPVSQPWTASTSTAVPPTDLSSRMVGKPTPPRGAGATPASDPRQQSTALAGTKSEPFRSPMSPTAHVESGSLGSASWQAGSPGSISIPEASGSPFLTLREQGPRGLERGASAASADLLRGTSVTVGSPTAGTEGMPRSANGAEIGSAAPGQPQASSTADSPLPPSTKSVAPGSREPVRPATSVHQAAEAGTVGGAVRPGADDSPRSEGGRPPAETADTRSEKSHTQGGSGAGEPGGSPLSGIAPPALTRNTVKPAPLPLGRLTSNRDWIITIECTADGVALLATRQQFGATGLARRRDGGNGLQDAVRSLINRRQVTVRPGELPYRPQVRFVVRPGGLRAYHAAFPALEALDIPMTRENPDPEEGKPASNP